MFHADDAGDYGRGTHGVQEPGDRRPAVLVPHGAQLRDRRLGQLQAECGRGLNVQGRLVRVPSLTGFRPNHARVRADWRLGWFLWA
jgi:hypothetical protein